jgi:hypothetical protein
MGPRLESLRVRLEPTRSQWAWSLDGDSTRSGPPGRAGHESLPRPFGPGRWVSGTARFGCADAAWIGPPDRGEGQQEPADDGTVRVVHPDGGFLTRGLPVGRVPDSGSVDDSAKANGQGSGGRNGDACGPIRAASAWPFRIPTAGQRARLVVEVEPLWLMGSDSADPFRRGI